MIQTLWGQAERGNRDVYVPRGPWSDESRSGGDKLRVKIETIISLKDRSGFANVIFLGYEPF